MKNFDLFCLIKPSLNDFEPQNSKKTNKKTKNPKKIKFLNQEIQFQIYKNETFIKNNLNNIFEKVVKNSLISEYYIIFSFLNELTLIIERSFILNQRINGPLLSIANQFKLVWYRKLNKKKIKYLFFYLLNKNKMLKFNLNPKPLNYTNITLQKTTASQFNPLLLLLFKNFLFPVKKKKFYKKKYFKKNIKTKLNLMGDGAISFCPDLFSGRKKQKLLNFVYNKKPQTKKTKLINFLKKDLKLNCLSLADDQKKPPFFNKNHSKLLKNNRFFSVHFKKIHWSAAISSQRRNLVAKNQITLKSDFLLKNLFYKHWFLNFLKPLKKSIFSFKNFIFFSRSKSISLSIKKLLLFLYLEPKCILNLEIVLKKTNLKFLLYSCLSLADKFKTDQFSNSNFSLSFQNKINTMPLNKMFKIASFPCQTSLNNKTNYFKVLKFNLCVANQITSLPLKSQQLKEYSLPLRVRCYMRNKKHSKSSLLLKNYLERINKKRFHRIQCNKHETSSNNRLKKTLITKFSSAKNFYKKILEIFYKLGSCPRFLSLKKITCLETNEFLLNSLINLSGKIFFNYLLSKVIFNIKNIINKRLQLNNSALNINLNKFNFKKNVLFKKYRFFNLKFNKITYRILKKTYYIFLYKSIKIYFMSNNFLFYLKKQYLAWVIGFLPGNRCLSQKKPLLYTFLMVKTKKKVISQRKDGSEVFKKPQKLNILNKTLNLTVNSFYVTRKNSAVYFFLEKKLIFVFLVAAAIFILLRKFSSAKNKKKSAGLVCNCFISVSVLKKTNLFFNLKFLKNRNNILKNNARPELFKYFFLENRIILYNFIEHSAICKMSTLAEKVLKKNEHLTFFNGLAIKKGYNSSFLLCWLHKFTGKMVAGRTKSLKNESSIYKFRNNLPNNIESSLFISELNNKKNYFKKKILIKIFNDKKTNFFFLKIKNRDRDKNRASFLWQKHVNKLKTSHNNKNNKKDLFYKQKYNLQCLINRVDLENFFLNFYQLILKIQVKFSQIFFSQVSIFHEYKLLVFDTKGNILNKYKNTFINILYKKNLTIKRKILLHTIFSLNRKKKEFIFYGFYIFQKMVYQQQKVNNFKRNLFIKESPLIHYCNELGILKKKNQATLKIQYNAVTASVTNSTKSRMTNCYRIPTPVTMIRGEKILKDNKNNIHLDFLIFIIPSKKNLNEHNNQLKSIIFKSLGKKQSLLIEKLAPIIRKWCNYFKDKNIKNIGTSYSLGSYFIKNHLIFKKTCISLAKQSKIYGSTQIKKINLASDFSLIKNLWEWSLKRHKNKNNTWIQSKYFYSINNHQFLFTKKRQICVLEMLRKKNIKKRIAYRKNNCNTISIPNEKVFIKNIFVDIANHY